MATPDLSVLDQLQRCARHQLPPDREQYAIRRSRERDEPLSELRVEVCRGRRCALLSLKEA